MKDKLREYRAKRDFSSTSEPEGTQGREEGRLRFCVQRHAARADHFDFRLESGGVALSWAVPKGPSFCPADKRLAVRVEDHPLEYMRFEGTIPKGEYGGGTVMLWDEGEWLPLTPVKTSLEKGSLKFRLFGERLKGDWALVRMKTDGEAWLLIKEKDGFAKRTAGISRFTKGLSGKTMAQIAREGEGNPFSAAEVMLARLTEAPPAGKGWLFELKYDGHRMLAFTQGGKTVLKTRNGYDRSANYPSVAEAVSTVMKGRSAVFDGELVVAGKDGISDFGALQAYRAGDEGLRYVIFDLLALDGRDLRPLPLLERKKKLQTVLKNAPSALLYSVHREKLSQRELAALKARGVEGIVMKRADSPYTAGKNGDWLKLKFRQEQEFVIGGFVAGEEGVRALLLGVQEGGKLKFAGKAGTGFRADDRLALFKELSALKTKDSPFADHKKEKDAVWVRPLLAAQTEFAERTAAGLLRQASFKGLRRDKTAEEVVWEEPQKRKEGFKTKRGQREKEGVFVGGVKITHPEKAMFSHPVVTKGELAAYYAAAAPRMLPFVKDRILSLVCCPAGTDGEKFFRRHLEGEFAGVKSAPEEGFFVSGGKGLVSLAQYNAVEFHVRADKKGNCRPDVMVFDLDPDEGLPLKEVRRGTRALKAALEQLGLVSFLKTSGGKGYHVVVPFREGAEQEKFCAFARQVAEWMEAAYPRLFTSNLKKQARKGKIYLDWQRNSPKATSAAPYSVRAREGAPVSMPIAWEELSRVAPASVTLASALRRLKKPDPWSDFFAVKATQRLSVPAPKGERGKRGAT